MGHGWSLYDWRERNIQWVQKWENDALADIVYQLRYIYLHFIYIIHHNG